MIEVSIPGRGSYALKHLALDLNGTIALDGDIIDGVEERLQRLGQLLNISIVTADTYGSARRLGKGLDIRIHKIKEGAEDAQKLALVQQLGGENTVSLGNGCNDVSMLRESALGICVLGREGAAAEAITSSDLVVPDVIAALDLLLHTDRLVASLRR